MVSLFSFRNSNFPFFVAGHKVLLFPDISKNAVWIANKKLPFLHSKKINANIWDMTEGKSDLQLKEEGV